MLFFFLITYDFLFKSSGSRADQRMPIEAAFIARRVQRERINCTFLMQKRCRFVETSARANRSSLFSRRSEIALFMRSPRRMVATMVFPCLTRFIFHCVYVIVYESARTYRQWVDMRKHRQVQRGALHLRGGRE